MKTILIAVVSLDGFITCGDTEGTMFASADDQDFFKKALAQFDCSIMGRVTFESAKSFILTNLTLSRKRLVLTRRPETYLKEGIAGKLEFTGLSPKKAIAQLKADGYQNCAVLGGSEIYTDMINNNLIDEFWITVESQLFGKGKPLFNGSSKIDLHLKTMERIGEDTVLLKYKPIQN